MIGARLPGSTRTLGKSPPRVFARTPMGCCASAIELPSRRKSAPVRTLPARRTWAPTVRPWRPVHHWRRQKRRLRSPVTSKVSIGPRRCDSAVTPLTVSPLAVASIPPPCEACAMAQLPGRKCSARANTLEGPARASGSTPANPASTLVWQKLHDFCHLRHSRLTRQTPL
jgi:hypothetical protein